MGRKAPMVPKPTDIPEHDLFVQQTRLHEVLRSISTLICSTRALICPSCETEFPIREKQKSNEVTELQLLTPTEARKRALVNGLEEAAKLAKAKVIKPFWVLHKLCKTQQDAVHFCNLMGYKKGFLYYAQKEGRLPYYV